VEVEDDSLKIAIVGRPNVVKSSLLNRLLGQERAIVSPVAGTTRDSVDTKLTWEGMPVTLIDTAGIRRRGSIEPGIEQFSVIRAHKALERADVALLLLDAVEGITAQDTHIGGLVKDAHRSVVIVVNKWDIVEKDNSTMNTFTDTVHNRFDFLSYAPILYISAKTGQRVNTVLPMAAQVQEERLVRIPTSELNALVREAMLKHPPASHTGRRLKVFYASQVRVDPPTFLFHVNDKELVHFSYARYLENQIREKYSFLGTPIRMSFRPRRKKEE
jgi:GTP-binding protein